MISLFETFLRSFVFLFSLLPARPVRVEICVRVVIFTDVVLQVFDKFIPRLTDSNSKVS